MQNTNSEHNVWGPIIRRYRGHNYPFSSRKDLAKAAGVSEVYLGEIERGQKEPSIQTLSKLAKALGVSLSRLFAAAARDLERKLADIRESSFTVQELRNRLDELPPGAPVCVASTKGWALRAVTGALEVDVTTREGEHIVASKGYFPNADHPSYAVLLASYPMSQTSTLMSGMRDLSRGAVIAIEHSITAASMMSLSLASLSSTERTE